MPTVQAPIGSGFGAASTAHDVVKGLDLSGKVAIVTGGYSGIGLETTRALRAAGASVLVPARDHTRAVAALKRLDGVELETMDLIDPASVDAFAARFLVSGQPLHILVNSAGIGGGPLTRDARGYEVCFAANHPGHFQLAVRLWPALCQANGARVVAVSAWAHSRAPIVFEDLHFRQRDYSPGLAYGQSKTANILFALALDERGAAHGCVPSPSIRAASSARVSRRISRRRYCGRRAWWTKTGIPSLTRRRTKRRSRRGRRPASGARRARGSTAWAASIATIATLPRWCLWSRAPTSGDHSRAAWRPTRLTRERLPAFGA